MIGIDTSFPPVRRVSQQRLIALVDDFEFHMTSQLPHQFEIFCFWNYSRIVRCSVLEGDSHEDTAR